MGGDPITASQYRHRTSKGRSNSKKKEGEPESNASVSADAETKTNGSVQNAGSGKKYRGRTKKSGVKAKISAKKGDAPQEDSLSVDMSVEIQPGGPGSSWGDPNAEW